MVNHAFSTDTLCDESTKVDALPVPSDSSLQQQAPDRSLRNVCLVLGDLMRNTRYVLIIVAHLVEGILLKGELCSSSLVHTRERSRNLQDLYHLSQNTSNTSTSWIRQRRR